MSEQSPEELTQAAGAEDSTPDPEADATAQDHLAENTDNAALDVDGDQSEVSQEPVQEDDVEDEDGTGAP